MSEAADLTLDELYQKSLEAGHDKSVTGWRYRLAKARARQAVAESQLNRLVTRETAGHDVNLKDIHSVELELADAAGAFVFCQEMVKAAATRATQQQPLAKGAKP